MLTRKLFTLPPATSGGGGVLTASIIPQSPVERYNPQPSGSSTQQVNAIVSGGTEPYTYLWAYVSGSTAINNSATTSDPTTFSAIGNGEPVNVKEAEWKLTVTDAALDTVEVNFTIRFLFGLEEP